MITYQRGQGFAYTFSAALSGNETAILHYAVSAYGFLLNDWGRANRQTTWAAFAALIRQAYSLTQQTNAVLGVIERAGA